MRNYAWLCAAALLAIGISLGCTEDGSSMHVTAAPRVAVPPPSATTPPPTYQYRHEIQTTDAATGAAMAAEFVVAVARVGDTSAVDGTFGDKQVQMPANVTIKSSGQGGETRTTAGVDESLRTEKLAPEPTPPGFGHNVRTQLISLLAEAGGFTIVERESINDILREQSFSSSEWVVPSGAASGELAAVRYIVKGALEIQSVQSRPVTPDNWADNTVTKEQMPYVFRLRMYSVRTGQIVAVGDGYAVTPTAAVESAVKGLRQAAGRYFRQTQAAAAASQPGR
jgi:curli biogenesis system outer membrane secretion channel CsgG